MITNLFILLLENQCYLRFIQFFVLLYIFLFFFINLPFFFIERKFCKLNMFTELFTQLHSFYCKYFCILFFPYFLFLYFIVLYCGDALMSRKRRRGRKRKKRCVCFVFSETIANSFHKNSWKEVHYTLIANKQIKIFVSRVSIRSVSSFNDINSFFCCFRCYFFRMQKEGRADAGLVDYNVL